MNNAFGWVVGFLAGLVSCWKSAQRDRNRAMRRRAARLRYLTMCMLARACAAGRVVGDSALQRRRSVLANPDILFRRQDSDSLPGTPLRRIVEADAAAVAAASYDGSESDCNWPGREAASFDSDTVARNHMRPVIGDEQQPPNLGGDGTAALGCGVVSVFVVGIYSLYRPALESLRALWYAYLAYMYWFGFAVRATWDAMDSFKTWFRSITWKTWGLTALYVSTTLFIGIMVAPALSLAVFAPVVLKLANLVTTRRCRCVRGKADVGYFLQTTIGGHVVPVTRVQAAQFAMHVAMQSMKRYCDPDSALDDVIPAIADFAVATGIMAPEHAPLADYRLQTFNHLVTVCCPREIAAVQALMRVLSKHFPVGVKERYVAFNNLCALSRSSRSAGVNYLPDRHSSPDKIASCALLASSLLYVFMPETPVETALDMLMNKLRPPANHGLDVTHAVLRASVDTVRAHACLMRHNRGRYLVVPADLVWAARQAGEGFTITLSTYGGAMFSLVIDKSAPMAVTKSTFNGNLGVPFGNVVVALDKAQEATIVHAVGDVCTWLDYYPETRKYQGGASEFHVVYKGDRLQIEYGLGGAELCERESLVYYNAKTRGEPGHCGLPQIVNGQLHCVYVGNDPNRSGKSMYSRVRLPLENHADVGSFIVSAQRNMKYLVDVKLAAPVLDVNKPKPIRLTEVPGTGFVHARPHPALALAGLAYAASVQAGPRDDLKVALWAAEVAKMVEEINADAAAIGFERATRGDLKLTYWDVFTLTRTASSLDQRMNDLCGQFEIPAKADWKYTTLVEYVETRLDWPNVQQFIKAFDLRCETINDVLHGKKPASAGAKLMYLSAFAKDEPTKLKKWDQGQVRVILSPGPLVNTATALMYVHKREKVDKVCNLDFVLSVLSTQDPVKYGWYCGGQSFKTLRKRMDALPSAVSYDFASWDRSVPAPVIDALYTSLYQSKRGGSVTYGKNLANALCHEASYRVAGKEYRFKNPVTLWPSGNLLTLSGNSLMNAALHRVVNPGVPVMVMGDDVIRAQDGSDPLSVYGSFGMTIKVVDDKPQFVQMLYRDAVCLDVARRVLRGVAHADKFQNQLHAAMMGQAIVTDAHSVSDRPEEVKMQAIAAMRRVLPDSMSHEAIAAAFEEAVHTSKPEPDDCEALVCIQHGRRQRLLYMKRQREIYSGGHEKRYEKFEQALEDYDWQSDQPYALYQEELERKFGVKARGRGDDFVAQADELGARERRQEAREAREAVSEMMDGRY